MEGFSTNMDGGRPRDDYGNILSDEMRALNAIRYYYGNGIPITEWSQWVYDVLSEVNGDIGNLVLNEKGIVEPESAIRFLQSSLDLLSSGSPVP